MLFQNKTILIMKNLIQLLIISSSISLFSFSVIKQQISGKEIMQKNYEQLYAKDEIVDIKMELINSKGKKRTRVIEQYQKRDTDDNLMNLIRFKAPADVSGTAFLSLEKDEQADLQWLFLPALNRSRRISASDESDNFMGSDFTYEDLDTEDLENFDYQLVGNVILNEKECYHINAIPNNETIAKNSGYSKREIFVSTKNFMVEKINFFNKKGVLTKKFAAESTIFIETAQKWRNSAIIMENVKTGHKTRIVFDDFKINQGLEDNLFSKRSLENFH